MFMWKLHFCAGIGERKWSLDLCVFRYASPWDEKGKLAGEGGMSELFSGAGVDSTSLDAASPSATMQLSLLLSSHLDLRWGIRLKSYAKPISRFEEGAPPRISSDDTAINVRELNQRSRERSASQREVAKFILEKLKRDEPNKRWHFRWLQYVASINREMNPRWNNLLTGKLTGCW